MQWKKKKFKKVLEMKANAYSTEFHNPDLSQPDI